MGRYLVGVAVVAAGFSGAAVGPAPAAPVPRAKPEPFLPTAVGTRWTTGDPSNPDRSEDRAHTVTAAEPTKGGLVVTVADRWQYDLAKRVVVPGRENVPKVQVVEGAIKYRVAADGVYAIARRDGPDGEWVAFDPPWCEVRAPAPPGAEWTNRTADGKYTVTSTVVGPERVTVPAGTFDAVRVRTREVQDGLPVMRRSVWYVLGVGKVKVQFDDPTDPRGMVLQSFTPAKK